MQSDDERDGLSLREVARRLRGFEQFAKAGSTLAKTELLNLLQTGKLTASAIAPTHAAPFLDLPSRFWITFSPIRFDRIEKNSTKRRPGVLYVEMREIADHYAKWFETHNQQGNEDQQTKEELVSALTTQEKAQVIVKKVEWARFVSAGNLTLQEEAPTRRRGRPASENWKEVLTFAAAEILASGEEAPAQEIAARAGKEARANASDPRLVPKDATIAQQIEAIYGFARAKKTAKRNQ